MTVDCCFSRRKLCRVLGIIANNTTELSEANNISEVGVISLLQPIWKDIRIRTRIFIFISWSMLKRLKYHVQIMQYFCYTVSLCCINVPLQ